MASTYLRNLASRATAGLHFHITDIYFHINKCVGPPSFLGDPEYDSNQRKRDLPEGESRLGLSREPATVLAEHLGDWVLLDGTEKALTTNVTAEEYGKAGSLSPVLNCSEVTIRL